VPLAIKNIKFEGNERFKRQELLKYLQTNKTSWQRGLGLAETQYLVKGRLKDDIKTLINLYRSAGYYDTIIKEPIIDKRKETSKSVTITIVIEEGNPIPVKKVDIVWASEITNKKPIENAILLHEGNAADMQLLTASKEAATAALKDTGYALATVKESMEVNVKEKTAWVRFEISPGPLCRVGDFAVSGLVKVRRDLVERELDSYKGDLYTPSSKKDIEDKLLAMNVFSIVSVYPQAKLNDKGSLDLNVTLVESDFQSARIGIGIALEPDMHKVLATSVYSHQNLFGSLYRFQLKTNFGYAFLPYFWQVDSHGPIALVEPSFFKKGLLEKELMWTLSTSFRCDVEEDYKYLGPTAKVSVSRFFFKRTLADLSYNFEFYYIYDATDRWVTAIRDVYAAFSNPARLGYLEAKYRIMLTDQIVDPKNGAVFEFRYAVAAKGLGSNGQYNKLTPSVSLYWQMFPRVQLATRVEVGFIVPFGDTTDTAIWSNYFLGGFNSMRGWGGKHLAPSVEFCLDETDCDTLRIGGRTMVLGNVEFRVRTVEGLYAVTFLDVGDVQYDVVTILPEKWNYTVGVGLRMDTPVGKVRFDVGFRVNDPSEYEDEPRLGIHLGLGEAF
jgi:outer membrane protein insertion porin family